LPLQALHAVDCLEGLTGGVAHAGRDGRAHGGMDGISVRLEHRAVIDKPLGNSIRNNQGTIASLHQIHLIRCMRTTQEIYDDRLVAAKELAKARDTTAGRIISELARMALTRPLTPETRHHRNGFPVLPARGGLVTPEFVDRLAEDEL